MTTPAKPRRRRVAQQVVYKNGNGNGNGNEWASKYGSILQTVLVMTIPFSALYIGVISPMANTVAKLNDEKVTIREHEEFRRNYDVTQRRMEDELLRFRKSAVFKDEMVSFEKNNASRLEGQANRLLKVEGDLYGASNIGKTVEHLQEQMNDIRRQQIENLRIDKRPVAPPT